MLNVLEAVSFQFHTIRLCEAQVLMELKVSTELLAKIYVMYIDLVLALSIIVCFISLNHNDMHLLIHSYKAGGTRSKMSFPVWSYRVKQEN